MNVRKKETNKYIAIDEKKDDRFFWDERVIGEATYFNGKNRNCLYIGDSMNDKPNDDEGKMVCKQRYK